MTNSVQTYEFTAYAEQDLLDAGTGNGSNLGCGDKFTMPGEATVCFEVKDNDSFLSGDNYCNENANDHSYQTASITDAASGNELGNGGQIYAEVYHWVYDDAGNWYVMIEVEQEGTGDDYFTFYTGYGYEVPPEGTCLTVHSSCNVTGNWVDFKCLDAGEKPPATGSISGSVWCDDDCDGIRDGETCEFGPELIVNGDFEDNPLNNTGWGQFSSIPGWYAVQGAIEVQESNYGTGNTEGNAVVELDAAGNSTICQQVEIDCAGTYRFSLDYAMRGTNANTNGFKVFVDGVQVAEIRPTEQGFQTLELELDLDVGTTRIDLKGIGASDCIGTVIDNVSLQKKTIVPGEDGKEGVTVMLMEADGTTPVLDENDQPITTVTDADGNYTFDNVPQGDYRVKFINPDGTEFTLQNQGGNDAVDSDVDAGGVSDVFSVVGGAETTNIDAGLKEIELGSLSGRYFCDDDGDDTENNGQGGFDVGVADKTVSLFKADGTFVASTQTGSDGSYRFDDLEAGDYFVEFESSVADGKGFVAPDQGGNNTEDSDVIDPNTGRSETVTVNAGEETKNLDAGVADLPGSLSGRYFCDDDGDGLDNDGPNGSASTGIQFVQVELLDAAGNGLGIFTETDANGDYSFAGLEAGTYGVRFDASGAAGADGKALTAQNVDNDASDDIDSDAADEGNGVSSIQGIEVTAGQDTPDNDAGVVPLGSLSGTYFCDTDGDDLDNGEAEPGIANRKVFLLNADGTPVLDGGGQPRMETTDGNGDYTFTDLPAGSYKVAFEVDPDKALVAQGDLTNGESDDPTASDVDPDQTTIIVDGVEVVVTEPVSLAVGEDKSDVDVGVVELGSIAGRVFCDTDGDDLDNGNGAEPGENGIGVRLINTVTNAVVATAVTATIDGVDGAYFFGDLAAGSYRVDFDNEDIGLTGKVLVAETPGDNDAQGGSDASTQPGTEGQTPEIILGVGENVRDVDAGIVEPNTPPEPAPDSAELCADTSVTIDVLGNDVDADLDALTITAVDGQAIADGGSVTLASGAVVTLTGGQLVYDLSGADDFDTTLIGTTDSDAFTYTVSDGTEEATAGVDIEIKGALNTLETIDNSLTSRIAKFTITEFGNNDGGFKVVVDGEDDRLDGTYEDAFCVDATDSLFFDVEFTAEVYLAADPVVDGTPDEIESLPDGIIVNEENLDLVNFLLNQDLRNVSAETHGAAGSVGENYTGADIQDALWLLTNGDDPNTAEVEGDGFVSTNEDALELAAFARANGEGFRAGEGDLIGLILEPITPDPDPTNGTVDFSTFQPFIIGVPFETLEEECIC